MSLELEAQLKKDISKDTKLKLAGVLFSLVGLPAWIYGLVKEDTLEQQTINHSITIASVDSTKQENSDNLAAYACLIGPLVVAVGAGLTYAGWSSEMEHKSHLYAEQTIFNSQ